MTKNQKFDIKKELSTREIIKITGIKYVMGTLDYKWFNSYPLEEFKRVAYKKDKEGNKYYWGQGVLLKP